MNNIQKSLITLIRNAMSGTDDSICASSTDDIRKISELAAEHDVLNIVSKALLDCNAVEHEDMLQQLMVEQYRGVLRYQQQKFAMDRICSAFDEAGIRYVLLKGAVIRDLYPEPELRTSSDIDILVDEHNMNAATKQLHSIGCEYYKRTDHDVSFFTSDGVHIELHHSLVSDKFVFGKPLGKAWECVHLTSGCRYDFANEFFVYYHYAHLAKHLVNGGFGIRFVLDLWLMMQKMSWDEQKLDAMLREGGIATMAGVVEQLAYVWFGDGVHNESTTALEKYIFDSGIYGNIENNVAINQRQSGGKFGNLLNRIFMPREKLTYMYEKLEKYPWLYPWYLVVRFFRILFKGNKKAFIELRTNQTISDKKTEAINKLFDMLDIR